MYGRCESYHLPFVHPQTLSAMNEHHSGCQFDMYPLGHAWMLMPGGAPGPHYAGRPERALGALRAALEFWGVDPAPYRNDLVGLRATPHPTDPTKSVFDMWYLTMFPEGDNEYWSNSMGDRVSRDHEVEHEVGVVGEVSCGPGIDRDVAIWTSQQQGLTSRGCCGVCMPDQERQIRFLHDTIDRLLALGSLP